jgi:hypothetical protein
VVAVSELAAAPACLATLPSHSSSPLLPPGCFDAASCKSRPSSLTSSTGWPQAADYSGLLNPTDPVLSQANFVFLRYCTSDAWVGSSAAPLPALPSFSMLGRVYLDGVLRQLAADHGLGASAGTRILFTGCSAGARGALFNTHYVAALLPSLFPAPHLAAFGALYDSAWWMDLAPLNQAEVPFSAQVQAVYSMLGAGAQGYLNPACTAAFPGQEGWKCMMGEYATNYTQSDYMIHVYQFDAFQLASDIGHKPASAAELAYANTFRADLRAAAEATVLGPHRPGTAALLPACYHHCNTQGSTFATATTDGVTLEGVLAKWFAALPGGEGQMVMEDCTGFACGKDCPV